MSNIKGYTEALLCISFRNITTKSPCGRHVIIEGLPQGSTLSPAAVHINIDSINIIRFMAYVHATLNTVIMMKDYAYITDFI